jgi:hypothetical protein
MADAGSSTQQSDATKIENARIGYQVAVGLWIYEGDENWARFNVMLVANSIILGVIGLVVTSAQPKLSISFLMSIVGLILCVSWSLITKRGFDYQNYYVKSARELEERFLAQVLKTVSRGSVFASGRPVAIELDGKPTTHQMSWWSRRAGAGRISLVVISLFALVYVLALMHAIGLIQLL